MISVLEKLFNKNPMNKYLTIEDISPEFCSKLTKSDIMKEIQILIIDDEKVSILKTLERIGYRVTQKKDIEQLTDVEPYDIIICDSKGVGKYFPSKFEGVNLAYLIKTKYPEKVVYLFSCAQFTCEANKFIRILNDTVFKGQEEYLIEYIDNDIDKFVDPKEIWKYYKEILRSKGVLDKQIIILEDLYVRSVNNKKDYFSTDKNTLQVKNNFNVNFNIIFSLVKF